MEIPNEWSGASDHLRLCNPRNLSGCASVVPLHGGWGVNSEVNRLCKSLMLFMFSTEKCSWSNWQRVSMTPRLIATNKLHISTTWNQTGQNQSQSFGFISMLDFIISFFLLSRPNVAPPASNHAFPSFWGEGFWIPIQVLTMWSSTRVLVGCRKRRCAVVIIFMVKRSACEFLRIDLNCKWHLENSQTDGTVGRFAINTTQSWSSGTIERRWASLTLCPSKMFLSWATWGPNSGSVSIPENVGQMFSNHPHTQLFKNAFFLP